MSFFSSKLEKLTIESYETKFRTGEFKTFEVKFNPESYSLQCRNVFGKDQAMNSTGREARYSMNEPEKIALKIILDSTGADEYESPSSFFNLFGQIVVEDVSDKVKEFLKMTYLMDGESHEPRFLKLKGGIIWISNADWVLYRSATLSSVKAGHRYGQSWTLNFSTILKSPSD